MQIMAIIMLFKEYHFVDPALYDAVAKSGDLDTLSVAVKLGRFDLVSMLLGLIAVLIGMAAMSGFWMLRGAAKNAAAQQAKEEAGPIAREESARIAREYLEEKAPELIANMLQSKGIPEKPEIGMSAQQVQEVIDEATEMGGNQNGPQ